MDDSMQKRIDKMIETVMAVSRGDYSAHIEISDKNDDLDSLAMGLNMMVEDIKSGIERKNKLAVIVAAAEADKKNAVELRVLNQQLRASEQHLKAANQQLKAKEQALLSKMADVERFNKLMVGRELEMIKLKREVNSLLETAHLPRRYEVAQISKS